MAIGTSVTFYNYSGDTRVVDKTPLLGSGTTITCYINDNIDLINPMISTTYADNIVKTYNYCYVSAWGRYYFVSGYDIDKGGTIYIKLSVDVLNSFASSIKKADVCVIRQENAGINYVIDDKLPLHPTLCDVYVNDLTGGTKTFATPRQNNPYIYLLGVI